MMKILSILLILTILTGIAGAQREQLDDIISVQNVHGSFSDIQELVDAILVDPSAQAGSATYSYSGTGDDAMGHVYVGNVGFLSPTHGASFIALSSGNAADVPGNPGDSDSHSTDFSGSQDSFKMVIPLSGTDPQLSFDFTFMSEEYPEFVGTEFNDYFHANICYDGTCTQVAFDDYDNEITVNNDFFDPSIYPSGTIFDGTTKLLTTVVNLTDYGINPGDTFTVEFEICDVGDNIYDSAVVIDNLHFTSGQTPGTTEIPEFPTIAIPVLGILGIMFLISRRKGE